MTFRSTLFAFRAALAALACTIARPAMPDGAAKQIEIPGDPKLPLIGTSPETHKVLVVSSGPKLQGTRAHLVLVKLKDGTVRPPDWVTVTWPEGDLDVGGTELTLKVETGNFTDVGEYEVLVQFSWTGVNGTTPAQPGATTKTIALVRPAPPPRTPIQLAQDRLGERTLGVTRSWPFGSTPVTSFDTAIAAAPLPSLSAAGESLVSKDLSEVEPALQVQPLPSASATDPQRIRITVPALHRVGTFGSLAHLSGSTLAQPAFIPVKVSVRDAWGFPLFVIALGVLGAFLFTWFAGTWRENELFAMARALLEADVAYWEARVQSTAARESLAAVTDLIAAAGRVAATGDVAKARQELQKAADALATFAKAQGEQRAALWKEVDALSAELGRARTTQGVPPEKIEKLAGAIAAVAKALRDRNAEAAAPLVGTARAALLDIGLSTRTANAANLAATPPPLPTVPTAEIRPLGSPETFVARHTIVLAAAIQGAQADDVVRWEVEGSRFARKGPAVQVSFPRPGTWHVTAVVVRGGFWNRTPVAAASTVIHVLAASAESAERRSARRLLVNSVALSAFAAIIASVTGLLALWAGTAFGTPTDYLKAFLWGFGIDGTVKGFTAVLGRLRGSQS